jgi:DNA-binding transcriptional LysR family regulator
LVGRFRQEHPGVSLHLTHPTDPKGVTVDVNSGFAEIGITEEGAAGDLPSLPLGDQELVAISPPGTPGDSTALPIIELAQRALVVTQVGTSLRELLTAALTTVHADATVAVETEQRDALVPLVIAGAGTAIVPAHLAVAAAALGATVQPLQPPLRRGLVLVHRPGAISPAAAAFVALATSTI